METTKQIKLFDNSLRISENAYITLSIICLCIVFIFYMQKATSFTYVLIKKIY